MTSLRNFLLASLLGLTPTLPAGAYCLNFLDQPVAGEPVASFDFRTFDPAREKDGVLLSKFARLAPLPETPDERALVATSESKPEWAVFFKTRRGLLDANSRYRVTVRHHSTQPWSGDSYAYLVVRDESPNSLWHPTQVFDTKADGTGTLCYEFLTGDDAATLINLGIHSGGSVTIRSLTVEKLPLIAAMDETPALGDGSWRDTAGICSHLDFRHFYKSEAEVAQALDFIQSLGVGWVRLGFPWDKLFPKSNQTPDPAMLRRLRFIVDEADKRHLKLLAILIATPPWASTGPDTGTAWRYPARHLSDYEQYIRFVATEFKSRVRHWEINNETNWDAFWMGSFEDYLKELHAASKILRAADPQNVILCAGLTDAGLHAMKGCKPEALRELLSPANAAAYDILSLHYYPRLAEETLYAVNNVSDFMRQQGVRKPIWITETGYSVFRDRTQEQATALLSKLVPMLAAHPDVERVFLYTDRAKDFEGDAYERGFGLLDTDFTPRPVYLRLKELFQTAPPKKNPALHPH